MFDRLLGGSRDTHAEKHSPCGLLPPLPVLTTDSGQTRRLGVEIEFNGLEIHQIASVIRQCLGGRMEDISDYESEVHTSEHGVWRVELDNAYLKRLGRENADAAAWDEGGADLARLPESLLALVARRIVPFEVVTPPLAVTDLSRVMEVVRRLGAAGAKGTRHATTHAFGVHLNPELPDTKAATLGAYLDAFLCLQDWLRLRCDLDLSRRLTPYIDPFPIRYCKRRMAADTPASAGALIDEYLVDNPTRNRALDMLPAFSEVDEAQVQAVVDDPRVQARPALHYRLPNCLIDEPNWNLGIAWRDWLQVEYLAHDTDRLQDIRHAYAEHLDSPAERLLSDWAERCSREFLLHELF